MDRTTAKRTLGSVFISLPLMFILTALKFYGVPGEGIGELCFLGAWLVGVAGIVFSEWLWERAVCDKVFVGISIAIVWGLALYGLNNWAMAHRPETPKIAGVTIAPAPAPKPRSSSPTPPSNTKPLTAKPHLPKSSAPLASPALLPAPQLSPNAAAGQTTARPQTPTYIPAPIPTISPYRELQNEIAEVNSIAQRWKSDLMAAGSSRGLMKRIAGPKGREEASAAADRMFRESVVREDERSIEQWHAITDAVKKTHSDAIARMSQPGPTQWAPNQISKDKAEFDGLLASMERPTEDSGNPDMQKFDPLLGYLKELLSKLGDYREKRHATAVKSGWPHQAVQNGLRFHKRNQFFDLPDVITQSRLHRRRHPQRLVNPAEVVIHGGNPGVTRGG